MISKEEIQKILQKKGDVRGAVFQTDANYILKQGGEETLRKVEAKLEEWGVNLKYQEVKPMSWYPVAWRTASLLATKETLGLGDEDIKEMGKNAPKASIIVKIFFKLFPAIEKFASQVPSFWRKHYTAGELEVVNIDKENHAVTIRLKDFAFHPVQCKYYEGYFGKTLQLTRPKGAVASAKELKCSFRDNVPYDLYLLKSDK